MERVGFIGVGIMGSGMVHNLLKNGFEVHIFARNRQKVLPTIAEGAVFHETIAECVKSCNTVITMVGFPKDVEEVYFAAGNIFDNASAGMYLIDMTSTSPAIAQRLWEEGQERGIHVIDAPVTGGDVGAREGRLSILAGGSYEDYVACLPVFKAMGTNINYMGTAGKGQHTKIANQIMVAGALSGVCEAFAYAEKEGLNLEELLKAVSSGAAGSRQLDVFGPKIIRKDYAPGFCIKHIIKDLQIARQEYEKNGLNLSVAREVLFEFENLLEDGKGELGTQTLIEYYR